MLCRHYIEIGSFVCSQRGSNVGEPEQTDPVCQRTQYCGQHEYVGGWLYIISENIVAYAIFDRIKPRDESFRNSAKVNCDSLNS